MMELRKRIKDLIEDRDTTQKKLAARFGVTEATMSGYLTGKYRIPAWLVLETARYFQVSTDYLYGLAKEPDPPLDLAEDERRLVLGYRALSRDQRELALRLVDGGGRQAGEPGGR